MNSEFMKITTKLNKKYIIIMAGGSGTRMKSSLPKQLLKVGNDPMLVHLLNQASYLNMEVVLIVSKKNHDIIINTLENGGYIKNNIGNNINEQYIFNNININIVIQDIANGTGGAIIATKNFFSNNNLNDEILILSADVPLISINTINNIFFKLSNPNTNVVILAKNTNNNFGYGRIILDNNKFKKIIEHKDCNEEQKKIKIINTGIYGFKLGVLMESLSYLNKNNSQQEYYLTDCPKYINNNYIDTVDILFTTKLEYDETLGANTPEQLDILRIQYLKKFTIENINNTMINISDNNMYNLIKVLEQLTNVGMLDISELKTQISEVSKAKHNKMYIQVVKFEDRIIGTGTILIENKIIHNMGKVGHIEDVVIDKKYRGLGLARKLITLLLEIAKEHQCYKVILDASDDVMKFYEKLGFKKHANNMRIDL